MTSSAALGTQTPEGDAFPVEVELSRAMDRLEQAPWEVTDWAMVIETFKRMEKFSPSAAFNRRQQEVKASA